MTDTTGEILHLLRPVEDAERAPHVDSGQHRTTSQAGLASIVAPPSSGYIRWIDSPEYAEADVEYVRASEAGHPSAYEDYNAARALYLDKAEREIERLQQAATPAPGAARVTLDLTPEQVKALYDVLDSGQQAIGDTTDRMEGEEYSHYDDSDRAAQRAFREAADAVVAVAIAALDAARTAAAL